MNGIGYTQKNIIEPNLHGYINVAMFSDEGVKLDGYNLMSCITKAHEAGYSSYYIPAGYYLNPGCEITWNCSVRCDPSAIFEINDSSASTSFRFESCIVEFIGGTFIGGYFEGSEYLPRTFTNRNAHHISLIRCYSSTINQVVVQSAKFSSGAIILTNCQNCEVTDCYIENCFHSGVCIVQGHLIEGYNDTKNIAVRNCIFKNMMIAKDETNSSGEPYQWCYAIVTAVNNNPKELGDKYESWEDLCNDSIRPLKGLVYENNYVDGSEDSALDTHGASNIRIINNTVVNTVCAITAYEDNRRQPRPLDFSMEDIEISNNYCYSEKLVDPESNYKHPFIFLGLSSSGPASDGDLGWNHLMKFDCYRNLRVSNNTFITASDFDTYSSTTGWLSLDRGGKNILIENNTFETLERSNGEFSEYLSRAYFHENITFRNNHHIGPKGSGKIHLLSSLGVFENNIGIHLTYNTTYLSYFKGVDGVGYNPIPRLIAQGDVYYYTSTIDNGIDGMKICTNYGIRCANISDVDGLPTPQDYEYPYTVEVQDNILHARRKQQDGSYVYNFTRLIGGYLAIQLTNEDTGTTSNNYVVESIDNTSVKLMNNIVDGVYRVKIRSAVIRYLDDLRSMPSNRPMDLVPAKANRSVSVRDEPKSTGNVIKTLDTGDIVLVSEIAMKGSSYSKCVIVDNNKFLSGYIYTNYIDLVQNAVPV